VNLRYPNPFTFPTPEGRTKGRPEVHPTRGAASNTSFGTAKKKPSNFWTDNVASKERQLDRFNQGLRKKDEGNRTLNLEAAFACGSLQCITRTSSCGLLLLFVCSERVSHLLRLSKLPILQLQTTANYCTVSEIYPGEENGTIRFFFFSQEATSAADRIQS
jgi:hypothetical protein